MIKWVIGLLITVAIGSIGFWLWLADKADLAFTVTSPMVIENNGIEQNWQSITISNSSNIKADEINIKIASEIIEYQINSFSEIDKYQVKLSPKSLDIRYETLPPQASLEIRVCLPSGEEIKYSSVTVNHDEGIGKPILSENKNFFNIMLAPLFFFFISLAFLWFGYSAYIFEKKDYAQNGYFSLEIIQQKKPFLIFKSKWKEIREIAIKNTFSGLYDKRNVREFLNEENPDYVNQNEYETLLKSASEKYVNDFWPYYSTNTNSPINVCEKLETKYPINLESKYITQIEEIASSLFRLITFKYSTFYSLEEIENDCREVENKDMSEKLKNEFKAVLTDIYMHKVVCQIITCGCDNDISKICNTDLINDRDRVKSLLYKVNFLHISNLLLNKDIQEKLIENKPEWMNDSDYEKIHNIAVKVNDLDNHVEKTKTHLKELTEKEFETEKRIKYFKEQAEKADRQLQIIDSLLQNPASIHKVEEYSNPFAKGNFENLVKISDILTDG